MNPQGAYAARTEKLYEQNENNIYSFEATVLQVIPAENGLYLVELDRTAFFPEGGGQNCDVGTLKTDDGNCFAVSHVGIRDGMIFHTVNAPIEEGVRVFGEIDSALRFRRMQNHSGEHIVSGLIHSLYGIENAGFHMSEGEINEMTIDTAAPLTEEMLEKVELLANRAIWENRPIRAYYPSEEELKSIEYRSKTELSEPVRLVEIEEVDICACCAPHVARTGEIGVIHIKGFMKYKRGVRITVVCGEDALDYLRATAKESAQIARLYSTSAESAYDAVCHREAQIKEKLEELHELRCRLLEYKLEEISANIGSRSENICIFEDGCDAGLMRKLANDGMKLTDALFAVFSPDGELFRYTVASQSKDLSGLSAQMREALGGKGGGKGNMITGYCEASENSIREFFEKLEY